MRWVADLAEAGWASGRKAAGLRRPRPRGGRGMALAIAMVVALAGWASAQCTPGRCPAPEPLPNRDAIAGPPTAVEVPPPAVVRVMVEAGSLRAFGSGTVIRCQPVGCAVLTCAHLFRDGAKQVWVFAGGTPWQAHVRAANPTWDLAVLEVPGWSDPLANPSPAPQSGGRQRCPVEPAHIASSPPVPGQWLQSCGFGSDGRYRCSRGQVLGYARTGNTQGYETLALSGAARLGDSGGPMFDAQGQLVAVVWGTDGRTVVGTYCGRIRSFLAEVFGSRRTPPGPSPRPSPGALPRERGDAGAAPPPRTQPAPPQDNHEDRASNLGPTPPPDTTAPALPAPGTLAPSRPSRSKPGRPRSGLHAESFDQALGLLASLKDRLERIESQIGPDNLRALLREAAGGGAAGPGLVEKLLPAVLVALGWTGPPAVAAVVVLRILAGLIRRRRARKAGAGGPQSPAAPSSPLNDDYAAQLAQVFALSGRSALADATLGREYDHELRQAEQSSDAALAAWARRLRERVARRFYRIHGQPPAPAEPAS